MGGSGVGEEACLGGSGVGVASAGRAGTKGGGAWVGDLGGEGMGVYFIIIVKKKEEHNKVARSFPCS